MPWPLQLPDAAHAPCPRPLPSLLPTPPPCQIPSPPASHEDRGHPGIRETLSVSEPSTSGLGGAPSPMRSHGSGGQGVGLLGGREHYPASRGPVRRPWLQHTASRALVAPCLAAGPEGLPLLPLVHVGSTARLHFARGPGMRLRHQHPSSRLQAGLSTSLRRTSRYCHSQTLAYRPRTVRDKGKTLRGSFLRPGQRGRRESQSGAPGSDRPEGQVPLWKCCSRLRLKKKGSVFQGLSGSLFAEGQRWLPHPPPPGWRALREVPPTLRPSPAAPHFGVTQQSPGHAEQLPLPDGEVLAVLHDLGLQPVREPHYLQDRGGRLRWRCVEASCAVCIDRPSSRILWASFYCGKESEKQQSLSTASGLRGKTGRGRTLII